MAVPDSTPPVSPLPNSTKLFGQTLIKSGAIQRAVLGRFRSLSKPEVLLASESHITLAHQSDSADKELSVQHQQPVHSAVLDLKVLPASRLQAGACQVRLCCHHHTACKRMFVKCAVVHCQVVEDKDHAVLLTDSNTVSLLVFDDKLHRYADS